MGITTRYEKNLRNYLERICGEELITSQAILKAVKSSTPKSYKIGCESNNEVSVGNTAPYNY
jgi:hypothetical protein